MKDRALAVAGVGLLLATVTVWWLVDKLCPGGPGLWDGFDDQEGDY